MRLCLRHSVINMSKEWDQVFDHSFPFVLELLSNYLPLTQTANTGRPVHDHGINIKHQYFLVQY